MTARTALAGLAAAAFLVAPAWAAAPPVGPLPAGPTMQITTKRGELVAVALPAQPRAASGASRAASTRASCVR